MSHNTEHEEMYVVQASNQGVIQQEDVYNNEKSAVKAMHKMMKYALIVGDIDSVRIVWEGELVDAYHIEYSESGDDFVRGEI